ncbi:glycosyltransferase family 1 protein [Desulfobacter sp.]|jgi:alpha-1,3-rhamnosyl/mannosyltransferase|uniref:glycosyltransferase family 4 protein n=1 Tax=Desulfobacter sp. TaxID=2294 RepID=UPI00257F53A6|nr:glycosyltransferase family 1 protein [Desulfobacter sp.]
MEAVYQPFQGLCFNAAESFVSYRAFFLLSLGGRNTGDILKILVNSIPMAGVLTGVARYLRNLYTAMGRMDRMDISYFKGRSPVDFIGVAANSARRQNASRTARYFPDPVVFGLRAASRLKYEYFLNRACKKKGRPGFDVYHETAFTPAKQTRVPTVYSVYDLSLRRFRETQPRDRVWLFECFIKSRLRYADHVLTISEFIRQEIIDEFKLQPSMVTAVPLAPDPLFAPCSEHLVEKVRHKYKLPRSYLLFVSSLEPRKNIDLLINALMISSTDIPLVLVGWKGWGQKKWREKIKDRQLANRIIMTGHIPDHDLRAVYSGARALVYPSLYEGFGLPIVEAMACDCPVICSNAASMPEAAGNAAVLVNPYSSDEFAHAIDTIVHDSRVRDELVKKGRAQAAAFTWRKTAGQTVEVFKKVIK